MRTMQVHCTPYLSMPGKGRHEGAFTPSACLCLLSPTLVLAILVLFLLAPTPLPFCGFSGEALAETWEEAAIRLEETERQEKVNAASRDLFYAITQSDAGKAELAIALGADVNQCVAFADATRSRCVSRMLDYAVQMYKPESDKDGGQAALRTLRVLLRKGALLVDDDLLHGRRKSTALARFFDKEAVLLLFLESGYPVTPDLLAEAAQFRSNEGYRTSYPLQLLLQKGPYGVKSTFKSGDFGAEVDRQILRHLHGPEHILGPLESTRGLSGIGLLHLAAVTGNTEVASYLIRQGADISQRLSSGVNALEIAWALWVYTWNEAVWNSDYRFELASFLDFIRLLMLHGLGTDSIESHYRANRELYEKIFVSNCQLFLLPNPNGEGSITLKDFLEAHFTRTHWSLARFDVLNTKASQLCTIVVNFEGNLIRDGARIRIPMVFLDNVLFIAGNEFKDVRFPVTRNGERLRLAQTLNFWKSLGLDVSGDETQKGLTDNPD